MKIFVYFLLAATLINFLFPPCVEWTESNGKIIFEKHFAGYHRVELFKDQIEATTIAWDGEGTGGKFAADRHLGVDWPLLGAQSLGLVILLIASLIFKKRSKNTS